MRSAAHLRPNARFTVKSPFIPLQSFKASSGPQRKSSEYQKPLLLLSRVPLSLRLSFFLSLLLNSVSPEWVFLSSLLNHPSLQLFLPVPALSSFDPTSCLREKEREREWEIRDSVPLRKTLRCQPAAFSSASAPRGAGCARPRWGALRWIYPESVASNEPRGHCWKSFYLPAWK